MVAAAIIGATAVVGAGASAYGASKQAGAAQDAAEMSAQGSAAATQLQRDIYNDQRSLSAPTARLGSAALAAQAIMSGIPVDVARASYRDTKKALAGGGAAGSGGAFGLNAPDGKMADWAGYWGSIEPTTRNNPTSPWHGIAAGTDGSPEALGQAYYQWTNGYGGGPGFVDDPNYNPATSGALGDEGDDFLDNFSAGEWASNDPGYQFRMDEGTKALERSAAARGMLFSGATGKGLTRYAQDYASNEFDKSFNRLGSISGTGQVATRDINAASGSYGAQAGANAQSAANARASGYQQAGNAWGKFWGDDVPSAIGWGVGAYGGYKGWGN